jgi:hypothetical protein
MRRVMESLARRVELNSDTRMHRVDYRVPLSGSMASPRGND